MEELLKIFEELKEICEKTIAKTKDKNIQKILKESDIANLQGIKDKLVLEIEGLRNDLKNIKEVVEKEKSSIIEDINKRLQEVSKKEQNVSVLQEMAQRKSNEATAQLELYKLEMEKANDLKANADKLIAEYSKKTSDIKEFLSKN